MAEHHFVTIDGIWIPYVVGGDGAPLLLLHDLQASLIAWAANIELLAKKFAVGVPGRGDSGRPNIDYRITTAGHFIRSFMEVVRIQRASLASFCTGGMVALRTALDYPDRVGKLVLGDT